MHPSHRTLRSKGEGENTSDAKRPFWQFTTPTLPRAEMYWKYFKNK